jgi:hypothetical protein
LKFARKVADRSTADNFRQIENWQHFDFTVGATVNTPAKERATFGLRRTGGGKQQLYVKWEDGVETIIATQP